MLQGMLNRFQVYDGTPLAKELEIRNLVYGDFPNRLYKTPDKRVDVLYDVVTKLLNPYLFVAYTLKALERDLRIVRFNAEKNDHVIEINRVVKYRNIYRDMMYLIMKEAVSQFLDILNMLKDGVEIEGSVFASIRDKVQVKSNRWLRMTQTFRKSCPVLKEWKEGVNAYATTKLTDNER